MNIKGQFYWPVIDIHLLLSQYSRLYKYLQYSVHDLALIVLRILYHYLLSGLKYIYNIQISDVYEIVLIPEYISLYGMLIVGPPKNAPMKTKKKKKI